MQYIQRETIKKVTAAVIDWIEDKCGNGAEKGK